MNKLTTAQISLARRLVMMVNVDSNHWVVVHANLEGQQIEILDSWASTYRSDISVHNWAQSVHAPIIQVLCNHIHKYD